MKWFWGAVAVMFMIALVTTKHPEDGHHTPCWDGGYSFATAHDPDAMKLIGRNMDGSCIDDSGYANANVPSDYWQNRLGSRIP